VLGIPDFRLAPDPYISFQDEYEKARILEEAAGRLSFEDLVRFYWEVTPDVPKAAAGRYVRYALDGEKRGHACLQELDAFARRPVTAEACLDLGCGTGGFLLAAADRFRTVVGADVALRWLVVARKRLPANANILLACCSAERLPFADQAFDAAVGLHLLEHSANPRAVLSETARTLKRQGLFFFSTPNRFSLGPEPCVRVWGVGFLPRRLAPAYVRLVRGIPYRNIRLLSAFEIRRRLAVAGLDGTLSAPRIPDHELRLVSRPARALIAIYHALRRLPLFSSLLRLLGPALQVIGRRQPSGLEPSRPGAV
jgi:2-polyprenyl-3-methyl-5-hydroxy-6-metoxy-1,4-benzoquinol methylase